MAAESLFEGATIRDRFVAAVSQDDEALARHLMRVVEDLPDVEDLDAQREEAWALLTAGAGWAARAFDSVDVPGTSTAPISDSEAAFDRAQHLDSQLWALSQQSGFHDRVALLVDAVKRACYRGADLGPIPGGRLGSFAAPGSRPNLVEEIEPDPEDLRAIGSDLGEALRLFGRLELGDPIKEAEAALRSRQ